MIIKDINELFKYSLVISCNERRLAYFNIQLKLHGLPNVKIFQAFTPKIYEAWKKKDSNQLNETEKECYSLFDQFVTEYSLNNKYWMVSQFEKEVFDSLPILKYSGFHNYIISYARMSHVLAVYYAKIHNYPYVQIFEDDAIPKDNCAYLLEEAICLIKKYQNEYNDAIFLYATGVCHLIPSKLCQFYNNKLAFIDIYSYYGANSYIVDENLYEKYIETANVFLFKSIEELFQLMNFSAYVNSKLFYNSKDGQMFLAYNDSCFTPEKVFNCMPVKNNSQIVDTANKIDAILCSYEDCIAKKIIVKDDQNNGKFTKAADDLPCCFDKQTGKILDDKLKELENFNR